MTASHLCPNDPVCHDLALLGLITTVLLLATAWALGRWGRRLWRWASYWIWVVLLARGEDR